MAASAATAPGGLRLGPYPVLLPKLSDPRLHLAATITSLQVLGQVAFDFRLSIAQMLISLGTCAVLEVAIAFGQKRILMWPASALLTGNGVAFILRVPGTRHGDWWSTRGWWIFAATAAVSLLSKHLIKIRGEHPFNPSNIGLVLCFLALGRSRAEPLDFWWGPMSWWMALAIAIILTGGFAILSRLKLLVIALSFWASFAVGIAILAATGHAMTARWHLGAIHGAYLWWILLTSPEVLVFLFFMITDPRTAPKGRGPRAAYAVAVGLLASLLIAPMQTEYATKVALLASLALVCAAMPFVRFVRVPRRALALAAPAYLAGLVAVGLPARLQTSDAAPLPKGALPALTILPSRGVESKLDRATAERVAHALVDRVPATTADRLTLRLVRGVGQEPPRAEAVLHGKTYLLSQTATAWTLATATPAATQLPDIGGYALHDVARAAGVRFRHGAFRYGVVGDEPAMMGGGVCWLDYNGDGKLDLFAVNAYADSQFARYATLPTSALYRNDGHGRFTDVSRATHANLAVRGEGCVAADLDGDGRTDLYVTTASDDVLLWNDGGRFTQDRRRSGLVSFGWHAGAAAADVNGDGRLDLFVAGYTDLQHPIAGSTAGFPTNHLGVRDELFLNLGHRRFRNVTAAAGIDKAPFDHSLGAEFDDWNGDGRPDLYVATDEDPNRLYLNEPGGPLGFRFVDAARRLGVADANAGMGIAAGYGYLFVTNSRHQQQASWLREGSAFTDERRAFGLPDTLTGWGDTWVDLANSGSPQLVFANGAIPVTNLRKDAAPLTLLRWENGKAHAGSFLPRLASNGRGLAAADYDGDGRVDLALNPIGGPLQLLHNTTRGGNWVAVEAPPATLVTVYGKDGRRWTQTVHAGSSYLSSEDPRLHFGLGATTVAKVTVRVPFGPTRTYPRVATNAVFSVPSWPAAAARACRASRRRAGCSRS